MLSHLLMCLVALVVACSVVLGEEMRQVPDEVLFRRALNKDQEIVARRGPAVDAQVMKNLIDPGVLGRSLAFFEVRVELHTANSPPLMLWSRLKAEPKDADLGGFDVLDVMVESGRITLATAESASLVLRQADVLGGGNAQATPLGGGWSVIAVFMPINRRDVSVKLSRSDTSKLTAEVVDKRGSGPRHPHTLYEQIEGKWAFQRIKQWSAPLPE